MEIINVTSDNIHLLLHFLENDEQISHHFRYFKSRDPRTALKNHIVTFIGIIGDEPIAYGHIDFEEKHWLGICVLNRYCGFGYGKQMLNALLTFSDNRGIDLSLSVDADNIRAIALYSLNGFSKISENPKMVYMMRKKANSEK